MPSPMTPEPLTVDSIRAALEAHDQALARGIATPEDEQAYYLFYGVCAPKMIRTLLDEIDRIEEDTEVMHDPFR